MVDISVNGELRAIPPGHTVAALLGALGLDPRKVAVERNEAIVSRSQYDETRLDAGDLKAITSHGELDLPDGCFVRIALPDRVHTYGIGMPLLELVRHPLDCGGTAQLIAA